MPVLPTPALQWTSTGGGASLGLKHCRLQTAGHKARLNYNSDKPIISFGNEEVKFVPVVLVRSSLVKNTKSHNSYLILLKEEGEGCLLIFSMTCMRLRRTAVESGTE